MADAVQVGGMQRVTGENTAEFNAETIPKPITNTRNAGIVGAELVIAGDPLLLGSSHWADT